MRRPIALGIATLALAACGSTAATSASTANTATAAPAAATAAAAATIPDGDWAQFNYDALRNGVGPTDTGIDRGDLHQLRRQIISLPGTVDASVIQLHDATVDGRARDVLIMTTAYGRTLALDARTGKRLWEYAPRDIGSYQGSAQITTATPTADPSDQYVYATSPDGFVHKLAVSNGHQVWETRLTYLPTHEKLASAPTIEGGNLVVVTDGYDGDVPPYVGHVVTLSLATGRIEHVFNSLCSEHHVLIHPKTCSASDSAIWGRDGAMLVPGSGDILVATANGPFNGHTNWGDSVLELSPTLALLHNWTPTDQNTLNVDDEDLGSTSPVLLPDPGGPPLVLQGGKAGVLDLINLNRLDGTTGPAGPRTGGQIQQLSIPNGDQMFTAPVVWVHGGRTYVFVGVNSGTAEYVLHSGRHPHLSEGWNNGTSGTSPVLAGGLLYVYDQQGGNLVVYDPLSGRVLDTLQAAAGHWNSPIVIGGRIVLPVGDYHNDSSSGQLYVWRLPGT